MNLTIDHSRLCDICKKKCIDDDTHKSKEMGCEQCVKLFFICGYCNSEFCPECNNKLKDKLNTFPYNLFKAISNVDTYKVKQIIYRTRFNNINEIIDDNDDNGNTLLICSAVTQNIEICKIFLETYGASVLQKNRHGRTALIEMIRCRSSKWNNNVAELFRQSVNFQDNDGRTALMFASQGAGMFGSKKGNIKIATQLINMGSDTTISDNYGHTPLWFAIESNERSETSNNEEMISFLKEQMIQQISVREFHKNYSYRFDDGVLKFEKK